MAGRCLPRWMGRGKVLLRTGNIRKERRITRPRARGLAECLTEPTSNPKADINGILRAPINKKKNMD